MTSFVVIGIVAVVVFFLITAAVKVVQEYERGVIFRLGRLEGARGPGLFFLIYPPSSKPCAKSTCVS